MEERIKTKRQTGFFILLDREDNEKTEIIKKQINSIDGVCLSKIGSVDEEKVFAEREKSCTFANSNTFLVLFLSNRF